MKKIMSILLLVVAQNCFAWQQGMCFEFYEDHFAERPWYQSRWAIGPGMLVKVGEYLGQNPQCADVKFIERKYLDHFLSKNCSDPVFKNSKIGRSHCA